MPACRPTKKQIERAMMAWISCGLPIGGVETRPDGTVRILAPSDTTALPSAAAGEGDEQACDEAFGESR